MSAKTALYRNKENKDYNKKYSNSNNNNSSNNYDINNATGPSIII